MDDETSPYISYAKKNSNVFISIGVILVLILLILLIVSLTTSTSAFAGGRSYMSDLAGFIKKRYDGNV